MRVECAECGRVFDDAVFAYFPCPAHPPIGGGSYCRKHDLFDCHLCVKRTEQNAESDKDVSWLQLAGAIVFAAVCIALGILLSRIMGP